MLQAKTNTDRFITLASLTKMEIARIRRQPFFCPMCNEQVIVRAGPQTIPHFAHKSKSKCPYGKGGESAYHEKGKFLLYQWLKMQGQQVELEHYLPSVQQRPDIFLTISKKRIAIEYQCSRIPIQTLHKRIRGYHRLGITPIWILSAKLFKRLGKSRMKFDTFLRHFMHHFSTKTNPALYFFCPNTKQFLHFQHIYFNRPNQAIGRITIVPLQRITFPELFVTQQYPTTKLYQEWKLEKRYFRVHQKSRMPGKELAWYNWLYEKGTHKEYLPSMIHVPVKGQHLMKCALWDWQSRICLDIIHQRSVGDAFTYTDCWNLLRFKMDKPHYYPLIKTDDNPIKEYLNFLIKEGTLQQINGDRYQIIKQVYFYSTLEKAIKGDELLMDRLCGSI